MLHSLGHLSREHLGNQEEEIEDHSKRFRKKARSLSSTVSSLAYLALCLSDTVGAGGWNTKGGQVTQGLRVL